MAKEIENNVMDSQIISKTASVNIDQPIGRKKRSTWTKQNAEQFKPIFNELIETGEPRIILFESVHLLPSTLRVKIYDALSWLAENSNEIKYARLKQNCCIRLERSGITIRLKDVISSMLPSESPAPVDWKKALLEFLSTANDGDVKEFPGVKLLGDEREILAGICAGVAVWSVSDAGLRVIKGV